jgi:indole-3-acetate monooxygenase
MMAPNHVLDTHTTHVEAARRLAPLLNNLGEEIDRERRLPPQVLHALAASGLFRMLVPRSLGGGELNLATFTQVVEEIAKVDGSVAWCLAQGATASTMAARLETEVSQEIFADPYACIAYGPGPGATATVVEGGYRLTGRWSFASGCLHATWLAGTARLLNEDGSPRVAADGMSETRRMFVPVTDAEILDTWHVSGLRGTGSNTYTVTDIFVPRQLTLPEWRLWEVKPHHSREPGTLYVFHMLTIAPAGFAAVALGIARGALEALLQLANERQQRGADELLRDHAVMQMKVGSCEAKLRAVRMYLYGTIDATWRGACATGELRIEDRVHLRLAASHAIHAAAEVVDTVYHAAGGAAIFVSHPFERRFRDVHAVTQQLIGRDAEYESAGRFFLGIDPPMK